MNTMNPVGTKIKEIRLKKGMSQEELASESQISLRTIQRIEKNENEPRGKTMQLICEALEINIEELLDYGKNEDRQFLMFFHLSVLVGMAIPTGNIILPLVLWLTQKHRIIGLQEIGARLINFQIVFSALSFILIIIASLGKIMHWLDLYFSDLFIMILSIQAINYIVAAVLAILNRRGKQITYPSIIPLIK